MKTLKEVAKILDLSPSTITQLIKKGKLKRTAKGITDEDLKAFIKEREARIQQKMKIGWASVGYIYKKGKELKEIPNFKR